MTDRGRIILASLNILGIILSLVAISISVWTFRRNERVFREIEGIMHKHEHEEQDV